MKGNINVQTENIFPVIKKFLYSDHEIFLRELVSNAVDATQKLKALASMGQFKGELGDTTIEVKVDKKTVTISDHGIGMTADEIEKYINQIAFSGAEDFLAKYKDSAENLIGHFGLGFYSAFMVSDKVEIETKSYTDAPAQHWECDGSPEYTLREGKRTERGTDIVLHISDDCKEFLEERRLLELLQKYCRFMPVAIRCGDETYWEDSETEKDKDGNPKREEKQRPRIVNNTDPAWKKRPTELTDEDYRKFYHELYPMNFEEPLFQIHLNVDYPFNLTGILYFPKVRKTIDPNRNKIQLYCNQVFVTNQVENIVPDFLTLLHGVIDSPDIPLNVSRSYLQSDQNVKKISKYITKKVSDRLAAIFKEDRKGYEEKWDDLKLFINYGLLSEEDFYEKAKDFALFKDTEGKYFTFEDYQNIIKTNQEDKDKNIVYLYATDKEEQYSYIEAARNKGYSVLMMDGQLDSALIGLLEQKFEKSRFTRVDADIIDRLIAKNDSPVNTLDEADGQNLSDIFASQLPKGEKREFHVETQAMGEQGDAVTIIQSEYMRRMKDLSKIQQGMSFYGQMPDMFTVVLNSDHPPIKQILDDSKAQTSEEMKPVEAELKGLKARQAVLRDQQNKKKAEEVTQEEKDELTKCGTDIAEEEKKKTDILSAYATKNPIVHQLIDLALLQNGLLKGENLMKFIKRSVDLIK